MGKYYAVQAVPSAQEADVYIFGDITTNRWAESDVSAASLVDEIKQITSPVINVHVDSYGGAVSEGWAIYNALRSSGAKIRTFADGFVASAAMYPYLAGDERYASSLSAFYLHEVMTWADGYADDLRKAADEAETMTEIGIAAFVERAGMEEQTVRDLMAAESWISPAQALDLGIVHTITAEKTQKREQSVKRDVIQRMLAGQEPTETAQTSDAEQEPEKIKTPAEKLMERLGEIFAR